MINEVCQKNCEQNNTVLASSIVGNEKRKSFSNIFNENHILLTPSISEHNYPKYTKLKTFLLNDDVVPIKLASAGDETSVSAIHYMPLGVRTT